ncbi:hypothetical protein GCM10023215_21080 [Pseudonocardia yuanmonensis]|uniref:SCP domain-containing protein n=1 Tax=Pseudonocardia yuanmonensis TaxID=1095914 RepID=A0ABP8WAN7_9PSEU
MLTTILRRSARVSVGVLAAGMLVGLAAPAVAETPVTRTAAEAQLPAGAEASATTDAAASLLPADSRSERRKERLHNRVGLRLINEERAKAGCAPLQQADNLVAAASQQSDVQARRDKMGHDGPNGDIKGRLGGLGYSQYAENVAQYQSAQEAVNAWMNSSGHRANILNCAYTKTGFDTEKSASGKWYWTQTFGA